MDCPNPKQIDKEIFSVNYKRATRMLANLVDAEAFSYCATDGADCIPTLVVLDYGEEIVNRPGTAYWHMWVTLEITCVPRRKSRWEIIIDAIMRASLIVIATIGAILATPIVIRLSPEIARDPSKAQQARRFAKELVRVAR